MLSAWGKTSISGYKYSGPFLGQNFCGIHRIPSVFKIQFFLVENIFYPFLLILKLEVMEDLIHYMLSFKREQHYFMKITYLNFKSNINFPNSSIDLKLRFSQCWSEASKFFPINKEILGFFKYCYPRKR